MVLCCLAGCNCGGGGGSDGGTGGGTGGGAGGGAGGGGGSAAWLLTMSGIISYGASATVGADQVVDPGGASTQVDLPESRTFEATKAAGGGTAQAKLVLTRDAHQLTLVGDVSGTSPGSPAFGAVAEIRDITLCVTAPGSSKVRVTYTCSATPQFTGHGLAGLTVAAGAITFCDTTLGEGYTNDTRGQLTRDVDIVDGENCWSEGTLFQFVAGAGQSSPGGTASVTGTATFRLDPL